MAERRPSPRPQVPNGNVEALDRDAVHRALARRIRVHRLITLPEILLDAV
jgi:hypothetical protein